MIIANNLGFVNQLETRAYNTKDITPLHQPKNLTTAVKKLYDALPIFRSRQPQTKKNNSDSQLCGVKQILTSLNVVKSPPLISEVTITFLNLRYPGHSGSAKELKV